MTIKNEGFGSLYYSSPVAKPRARLKTMPDFSRRAFLATFSLGVPLCAQPVDFISPRTLGAKANGEANDTAALQRAIDFAFERGGGTVHLDAGRYLSGTLNWRSNVTIWLDNGATIVMSPEAKDFAGGALLAADDAESIAIFGQGTIDCNRTRSGGPKPIALRKSRRVSIRGITLRSAPSYNISLIGCDYVDIDGVTILNGFSDGIDPDSSRFVRISNCFIESVDDAIALKTTLADRRATEHVTVTNCVLRTASIHLKCGTESCGDFRNIAFSNCTLVGGMGMRHGNPGVALYTVDGGVLEDIVVSNITMRDVGIPLAILRGNRDRCNFGGAPGNVGGIQISNIRASGAKLPSVIAGLAGSPIAGVRLDGVSISTAAAKTGPEALEAIPEKPKDYPDPTMFGPLPAHGLFIRHAKDLLLRDVHFDCPVDEKRAALVATDAERLHFVNLEGSLWLDRVRDSEVECDHEPRVTGDRERVTIHKRAG
jgi:hypothetical protein